MIEKFLKLIFSKNLIEKEIKKFSIQLNQNQEISELILNIISEWIKITKIITNDQKIVLLLTNLQENLIERLTINLCDGIIYTFNLIQILNEINKIINSEKIKQVALSLFEKNLSKWKKEQNDYYEFSEINFIINMEILYDLINKWLENNNQEKILEFYKYILIDGNKNGLIAFGIKKFEEKILNIDIIFDLINSFYKENKEYISIRQKNLLSNGVRNIIKNIS